MAKNAALKKSTAQSVERHDVALAAERGRFQPYTYIENGGGFQGRLANYARTLVRGAAERDKPNGQRFREFTDSALPRVQQNLGASVPVYPELENCVSATVSNACASG